MRSDITTKNKYTQVKCNLYIPDKGVLTMPGSLKQDIHIGRNMKALRKAARLSQEAVAAKLQTMDVDISREILSQMENGKYNVRVSVLLGLKEIYGLTSFDVFFEGLHLER